MAVNDSSDRPAVSENAGDAYRPYIPAQAKIREFTPLPLILGTLLGMVFGASSLYLVLRVGLTVSASIPVAVISITLFGLLAKMGRRNATILENNIVQTAGSAGESIAFGVGITMPAILILGFDLEATHVLLVAVLGCVLGILMMIPLRRALIVKQHGTLKYPEGTACAEVLKAGASDESRAAAHGDHVGAMDPAETRTGGRTIFSGFGIGAVYMVVMSVLKGWKDTPSLLFGKWFGGASAAMEVSPALLGVGYIIGPRIAAIMFGGGVLAYMVLIPLIKFFGSGLAGPLEPGSMPISEMSPDQVRGAYILYIGAGAVAAGGIVSLFRSLPVIWSGLVGGLASLRGAGTRGKVVRTDRDLPIWLVIGGIAALTAAIVLARVLSDDWRIGLIGAILILVFGFLFVTVSSRLVGEIGSSSNPISGMTIATLLLTCLIFVIVGWTGPIYYVMALSIGAIACIAISNAGATSQDLKTGFLVGATPRYQQIAILIGALASALLIGPILLQLNNVSTVYVPPVTFAKLGEDKAEAVSAAALSQLPAYDEAFQPPGGGKYHILVNSKAAGQPTSAPAVEGLSPGEYLVNDAGEILWRLERNFSPALAAAAWEINGAAGLQGPQAQTDSKTYRVWQKARSSVDGPAGKYLVTDRGQAVYFVDPGINGTHKVRPDGTTVTKYDAPKATLVSYIIKGILNGKLPWGLVLLGVMIALVLELAGIPSLAFAVGVYLPISTSSPIFVGGLVRRCVDYHIHRKARAAGVPEAALAAEADKGSGVLLASGYIAGAAIAGIVIAFMTGLFGQTSDAIETLAGKYNPLFADMKNWPSSDLLSLIPFAMLTILLYAVGRKYVASGRRS